MRKFKKNRYNRYEAVYGRDVMIEMTDAERYVRERLPDVRCAFDFRVYDCGPFPVSGWVVMRSYGCGIYGFGKTDIAAWADAANRLEARERVHVLDSGRKL